MHTAILLLLAFQASAGHPAPLARLPGPQGEEGASSVLPRAAAEPEEQVSGFFEEREFMERMKGLSKALADFAATYKSGEVDLRKVKAVRKAMHELEKSEWFRPQKPKGQVD